MDDPFGAAVLGGGHGSKQRGYLGDPHKRGTTPGHQGRKSPYAWLRLAGEQARDQLALGQHVARNQERARDTCPGPRAKLLGLRLVSQQVDYRKGELLEL